jgi:hypothetical protein
MSLFPDLRPAGDARSSLGKAERRWRRLFAEYLSDGTNLVPVADLATRADVAKAAKLPAVGSVGTYLGVSKGQWAAVAAPAGVLPVVDAADNDKYLVVYDGRWQKYPLPVLPQPGALADGSILRAIGGAWAVRPAPQLLPAVSGSGLDDGKILQVVAGHWAATAPPSDVLPLVGVADHGMILQVVQGVWSKRRLELAGLYSDGLAPRLPGSPGRLLAGDNTWVSAPTGASGQWRIGDLKHTVRAPAYGWLPADGSDLPFSPEYQALYLALGGSAEDWDNQVPLALPDAAGAQIRYLPDSQAPAEFGVVIPVAGSSQAGARIHLEFELYRDPAPTGAVVAYDTFQKAYVNLQFSGPVGTMASSSPGWFWYDHNLGHWRLYNVQGEEALPGDQAQALIDLAEAAPGTLAYDRLTPGSYYYRHRQIERIGSTNHPGRWVWGRILSTGGLNAEPALFTRLCDLYSTGLPQRWTLPRSAARLYLVTTRGVLGEGFGISALDAATVLVDEGSAPGARLTLLGQGYVNRNRAKPAVLDIFEMMPRYSVTLTAPGAAEDVGVTPLATAASGLHPGWGHALNFTYAGWQARPGNNTVTLFQANGGSYTYHMVYNHASGALTHNSVLTWDNNWPAQADQAFGAGNYVPAAGTYDYILPPVADGVVRYYTPGGLVNLHNVTLPAGHASWRTPYFRHCFHVSGHDYFIPGEAPGIWDDTDRTFHPFPVVAGVQTRFCGGKAAAVGPDGRIYCLPRFTWEYTDVTNSNGVLCFDPRRTEDADHGISFLPITWGLIVSPVNKPDYHGWHRAVLLRDGRILCVPYWESDFVIIDTAHGVVSRSSFGASLPGTSANPAHKWMNAFVMADGSVCGFGMDHLGWQTTCFRFNPDRDRASLFTYPQPITAAIRAGAVLPDGGVILAPYNNVTSNLFHIVRVGEPSYTPGTDSPIINHPGIVSNG